MKAKYASDRFRTQTQVSSEWVSKRLEIQCDDKTDGSSETSSSPSPDPSPDEDGYDGQNKRALTWWVESLVGMHAPATRKTVNDLCAEHHLNQQLAPSASYLFLVAVSSLPARTSKLAPCGTMAKRNAHHRKAGQQSTFWVGFCRGCGGESFALLLYCFYFAY